MAAFNDKARNARANNDTGSSQMGKAGRWSSGPPQFSRAQRGSPVNSKTPKGAAAAGAEDRRAGSMAGSNGANSGARMQSKARAAGSELIEGEAPDQVEAMHTRLLCLLAHLVGLQVKVTTTSSDVYHGILFSINPNDAQSLVLRYAYAENGSKAAPPIDTLVIRGEDCLEICGEAAFSEVSAGSARVGFKTDTDISRSGGQASARELHRWVPEEGDELGLLESGLEGAAASNRSWDQFATNEQLFGLTTDFDEEIYTTKLDRTRADYKEREREAIRIAQEIQSTPFLNSHVAEERQDIAHDDGAMDEEDRYGAVLRPSGAPGKYVPPYMRSKTDSPAPAKQTAAASKAGSEQAVAELETPAQPNNAMAAAALAKLNIRTTGHASGSDTGDAKAPEAAGKRAAPTAGSPSLGADPAITALSKAPSAAANSKLSSLRGNKHRADIAALNKPMADITEKLNSERERIHQHKQALLKTRVSELVKFHQSFKLPMPMPDDIAEIVGAKKKADAPQAASSKSPSPAEDQSAAKPESPPAKPAANTGAAKPADAVSKKAPEAPKTDQKKSFKFNAKASSFKPSAAAAPFVPKFSASSSRASSSAGTSEYNVFFGRRALKKAPQALWGGSFKLPDSPVGGDDAPTWPFGSRTYRSQFVPDEPEAMMYPPQGFMPPYGYGYYQHYQYPPQMGMVLPGAAAPIPASSPYSAAPYGGRPVYAPGPYSSTPGYPSPVMVGDGRSPIINAVNAPTPPTVNLHAQSSGGSGASSVNLQVASTSEMGPAGAMGQAPAHIGRSGSDSPSVMYGTPPAPPMHMGMVPPPMPFNGMHAAGYMGPSVPPQGYPSQSMPMPMGYPHYPPAQGYSTSPPPGMVMMHGSPHPEQGMPSTSHPSGY
ncbi:poly(A)-binding protein binding protein [Coemansia sp. RSA 2711]|nr:poly(A)-binding protein binding protein [Coemansia sp. RSA 2711]